MSYNTAAIRELLTIAIDDQELTALCFDHFSPVYENLAAGMGRLWKIQLLIDYCKRHHQFDKLLTQVQKINPEQYSNFISLIQTPSHTPQVDIGPDKGQVEIMLKGDLSSLAPELQRAAIAATIGALSGVLDIPDDQIRVSQTPFGGRILPVEMPRQAINRLIVLHEANDPVMKDLGIQQAKIDHKQPSKTVDVIPDIPRLRPNPFTYSGPVPDTHFIGRRKIINQCYDGLAGLPHSSISIVGSHGIGKTSLLHYLKYLAKKEGWGQEYGQNIFVYLYCQTLEQFSATRFWRRILETLKHEENNPNLHQKVDVLLQQQEISSQDIENLLDWLHEQKYYLVLLLDSFSWLIENDTAQLEDIGNFLVGLRALTNRPYALTMFTVTHNTLDELCGHIVRQNPGSDFYNNFITRTLLPFTAKEVDLLIEHNLKQGDLKFTPEDREFLNRLAGNHPRLVQMAGYHLFNMRRNEPLESQNYAAVISGFEDDASQQFFYFWVNTTVQEKMLLLIILLLQLQFDLKNVEIDRLFVSYRHQIERLIKRGLIQRLEGVYEISSYIFAKWIALEGIQNDKIKLSESISLNPELRAIWRIFEDISDDLVFRAKEQFSAKNLALRK